MRNSRTRKGLPRKRKRKRIITTPKQGSLLQLLLSILEALEILERGAAGITNTVNDAKVNELEKRKGMVFMIVYLEK